MGLLGGIWNAVTSPFRFVGNVIGAAANGVKVCMDAITFNGTDLKRDLKEMGSNLAGAAFSGVEAVGLAFPYWGWAGSALVGTMEKGVRG